MARRKSPEDMSVEELRRLLIEKRRGARRDRLEHFKGTGRVVDVAPDILTDPVPVVETPEGEGDQPPAPASKRSDGDAFAARQGAPSAVYLTYISEVQCRVAANAPRPFGLRPKKRHAALLVVYLE